jgi:predicted flap endonuclease-1-like 5' DNA nuclease
MRLITFDEALTLYNSTFEDPEGRKFDADTIKDLSLQMFTQEGKTVPDWFNVEKLEIFELDAVASYDEAHSKCTPGSDSNGDVAVTRDKKYILLFPRDENGRLDLENGSYNDNKKIKLTQCKYTEEVRMMHGVAMVTPIGDNGEHLPMEGRRCKPFDYTGKTLLTIPDFNKRIKDEIARVKALAHGETSGWVVYEQGSQEKLYKDDSVLEMKRCGRVTTSKLHEAGVFTIVQVLELQNIDIEAVSCDLGLSKLKCADFIAQAQTAEKTSRPGKIDYRAEENPYHARYGEHDWMKQIKKSVYLSKYACISDLVDHMKTETERVFKGTTHEHDCRFYHDALSLLTAKTTKQYMTEKGILPMWILPQQGLMKYDESLKNYYDRPVGNSAELMVLDNTLNKDIHESVAMHIQYTSNFGKDDIRKFSMATPKKGASAYRRITDPIDGVAPSSERIMQDVRLLETSIKTIIKYKGTMCMHVQKGRRLRNSLNDRRGGRRERGHTIERKKAHQLHNDAIAGRTFKLEKSKNTFRNNDDDE